MEKLVWLVEQAVVLNHMDIVEVFRFVVDVADRHGYAIDEDLLDSLHNRYSDIDDHQDMDAATKRFQQARLLAACPSVLRTNTLMQDN